MIWGDRGETVSKILDFGMEDSQSCREGPGIDAWLPV